WLLASCLSVIGFSLPAAAGTLLSWRFDVNQNQLLFTTDAGVQPKALLMFNPTRLVIDLPGTNLGRPTVTEPIGGAISSLRIGQAEDTTTRLVLELNPGYTLNPQQVLVRGATPLNWSVQIPKPTFVPISQGTKKLPSGTPSPTPQRVVEFVATPSAPPLNPLPPSVVPSDRQQMPTSFHQLANIQSVELATNGTLLLIKTDRAIKPISRWDKSAGVYRITIPDAQLADKVKGPQLAANSPVTRLRLRQQSDRPVEIIVQPAAGVVFGELNHISDQIVALTLQRTP
nr:AMIN domain-containing protein [Aphanothece sp. CMT-3BRIN-NPC111]